MFDPNDTYYEGCKRATKVIWANFEACPSQPIGSLIQSLFLISMQLAGLRDQMDQAANLPDVDARPQVLT